jgi:putative ABC transport system ATP-binding protein
MEIHFKNIIPHPLDEINHLDSSIWGQEYKWKSPSKTIVYAVSGKGKSTFVDILSGVRKDFSGDLFIDSKSILSFSHEDWSYFRTHQISTIYQDLQLFDNLSIIENIRLKNELTNHFSSEKIVKLIERIGLKEQIDKKSKVLSYGQKQRVAIIRALAQPFKVLILDEPFSHLDKENEKLMMCIILEEVEFNNAGLIMTSLGETPDGINYKKINL